MELTGTVESESRSFGRSVRLKGRSGFLETIRGENSRKIRGKLCQISIAATADNSTKFGISVSRKAGNAVRRNRLKRVVREFLRNNKALWPAGRMVVIYLAVPVDDEKKLLSEICEMLKAGNE